MRPRIGISSCFFHPDDERPVFKSKTLLYVEQSMSWWVQAGGALTYPIPTAKPRDSLGGCAPAARPWAVLPHRGGDPNPAAGARERIADELSIPKRQPPGVITLHDYAADLDGLLLHGGSDVCPRTYGEAPLKPEWDGDEIRDRYEIDLVHAFLEVGKPVLGICRGQQILNVAFGGTLWQDQREQGVTDRVHRSQELYDRNMHQVDLVPGTKLAKLYPGQETALVNSIHHQAVREVGQGLVVEATSSDDGIIEAIRLDDEVAQGRYVAAVQWHPEFFEGVDEGTMLDNSPILEEFLTATAAQPPGR